MMQAIRRHVRRLWPRSPLWVPGFLLLLIIIVSKPLLVPDWIRRELYSIPANRMVEPVWVEGAGWPPKQRDDRVLIHSIWGTRSVRMPNQIHGPREDLMLLDRECCAPVFTSIDKSVTLSNGATIWPQLLVYEIKPSIWRPSPHEDGKSSVSCFDLILSKKVDIPAANAILGKPWRVGMGSGTYFGSGRMTLAFGLEVSDPASISSVDIHLIDADSGKSISERVRPIHVDYRSEELILCSFEYDADLPTRKAIALDIVGGSFGEVFEADASTSATSRDASAGLQGPRILRIEGFRGSDKWKSSIELLAMPDDFAGIEIDRLFGEPSHREMRESPYRQTERFYSPKSPGEFRIKFLYRPDRHRIVFHLDGMYSNRLDHQVPDDWADYVSPPILGSPTQIVTEGYMVRGMGEPFPPMTRKGGSYSSDWLPVGVPTRDIMNAYFVRNPQIEIWQSCGEVNIHAGGDSFQTQYPRLSKLTGSLSMTALVKRSAAILLMLSVVLLFVRLLVECKSLRRKGYDRMDSFRGFLLYSEFGRLLSDLPTRDEAASLPDVDVTSWRSLRRLLKQRITRE